MGHLHTHTLLGGSYFLSGGIEGPLTLIHPQTYMNSWTDAYHQDDCHDWHNFFFLGALLQVYMYQPSLQPH